MSYVDNNLLKDERVVLATRTHKIVFLSPVILVLASVVLIVLGAAGENAVFTAFGCLFFVTGLFAGLGQAIRFWTTEFAVTDRRVMVKTGLIRRDTFEQLHGQVEGFAIRQGILGRILDFGTVEIRGTGGGCAKYAKIANPLALRRAAQEQAHE